MAEVNNGQKGWGILEQYYVDDSSLTGKEKPNEINDPDYVGPVDNLDFCPLPVPSEYTEASLYYTSGEDVGEVCAYAFNTISHLYTTNGNGVLNVGDTIYVDDPENGMIPFGFSGPANNVSYMFNSVRYWIEVDENGVILNKGLCSEWP